MAVFWPPDHDGYGCAVRPLRPGAPPDPEGSDPLWHRRRDKVMGLTRVTITHPHSIGRVAFRFVSGRPLDGVARTDARFLRAGTRALTRTGYASRWAMLPGWRRAVVRLTV